MSIVGKWKKEAGGRLEGSRPLDCDKVQAPGIARVPGGGYRLFYTAVGSAKPFAKCQGYILSAVSDDGLTFRKEEGIRVAPQPDVAHMSRRVLSPTIAQCDDGRWRMYFESRGPVDVPAVICSAVSEDMLNWEVEDGIRLEGFGGLGGPRFLRLPDGRGRIYCFAKQADTWPHLQRDVICAITSDGLNFVMEPDCRFQQKRTDFDSMGITAAEVIAPATPDGEYTMVYSEWQDLPPGVETPPHPSEVLDAAASGGDENFAAASIAADLAGYRSRIYTAHSSDGILWDRGTCIVEGSGCGGPGLDAVHAEDMSVIDLGAGRYRMYYAACDKDGNWRIASAVTPA